MARFRWAIEVAVVAFWYPVASGSGISRETRHKHFCNLTTMGIKS